MNQEAIDVDGGTDVPWGWVATAAATVYGSLTTAIAVLFKANETRAAKAVEESTKAINEAREENKAILLRLDESDLKHMECLEDRNSLRVLVARMEAKLESIDGN